MRVQLNVRQDGVEREVLVDAPAGTSAADLAAALGAPAGGCLLISGRPVAPHVLVGSDPLLQGAVVTVSRTGPAEPRDVVVTRAPRWRLRVDSGPDTGLLLPLPPSPVALGRAPEGPLRLTDPGVSRRHLEVDAAADPVVIRDLAGTNGTRVDGRPLGPGPAPLADGSVILLGSTTLGLERVGRDPRRLPEDGDGRLFLDVQARPRRPASDAVRFPDPPPTLERSRFPLVALIVPLVVAGTLAAMMHSPTMLLFGLSGPVLSVAGWAGARTGRRRQRRTEAETAARSLAQAHDGLRIGLSAERQALESAHPPATALLAAAEGRSTDVWSGGGSSDGSPGMPVRLGRGARRASTTGEGATAPPPTTFDDAPVTLDLTTCRVLHVQGSRASVVAAVSNVLGRLAAQYAPSRVEVQVLVATPARAADWSFVRLLPHTSSVARWNPGSEPVDRGPAGAPDPARGRGVPAGERDPPAGPFLVVVVDGPTAPAPGGAEVELPTPDGRAHCLVVLDQRPVDATAMSLPSGVAVLRVEGLDARLRHDGIEQPLRPDLPGPAFTWRLARALAPLRERSGSTASSPGAPSRARLLAGGQVDLAERWSRRPRSTVFRLGLSGTGPVDIDLAVDGPHALVAGTTGSGKSELLQTLVCSLALANRPDEMAFVLVDYKGGAAFRGCAELPHVLGWVTDLDAHLTRRALTSLGAEVRRRERLLAAAGVADLEGYQRRRERLGHALAPLPRLVIVVDEFRVLAEELPDFVQGLVRLAAVGRSLGIHLVLATQRPGGVVTADMRANLSLRIALRVRDRMDSLDVIDSPAAAEIAASTPGRAFLRGAATDLTPLQTALVTGRPDDPDPVRLTDVTRWWDPAPLVADHAVTVPSRRGGVDVGSAAPRDLDTIVAATTRAARDLGIAPTAAPWLPPLPDMLDVSALDVSGLTGPGDVLPLGMEDRPDEQRQHPWCWPLDRHVGIAGGPGSGRTTALLTVGGRLAERFPPDACHLYAIGTEALSPLAALPHTSVVANARDAEHVALVVERLTTIVRERVTDGGPTARPLVVALVDGWEQLAALDGGAAATALREVLDPGRGVGVLVVVTGGRALLSGPVASALGHRLALRLPDPVELALVGIPSRSVPLHQPPGRALDVGTHREVQLALLSGSTERAAHEAWLATVAAGWVAAPGAHGGPSPVRVLPESVSRPATGWVPGGSPEEDNSADGTDRTRAHTGAAHTHDRVVVGVRAGDLHPVGFALRRGGRRVLVVGPPGSGRTTALGTLALDLLDTGRNVAVIGPDLARLLGPGPRRHPLDGAPDDLERLVALRRAHTDLAVLVDDAERLGGLAAVVREVTRLVDDDDGAVVAATTPAVVERRGSALVDDLAAAETGVLLHPRPGTRLWGVVVGARDPATAPPPGRGLLVAEGTAVRVQVAAP